MKAPLKADVVLKDAAEIWETLHHPRLRVLPVVVLHVSFDVDDTSMTRKIDALLFLLLNLV